MLLWRCQFGFCIVMSQPAKDEYLVTCEDRMSVGGTYFIRLVSLRSHLSSRSIYLGTCVLKYTVTGRCTAERIEKYILLCYKARAHKYFYTKPKGKTRLRIYLHVGCAKILKHVGKYENTNKIQKYCRQSQSCPVTILSQIFHNLPFPPLHLALPCLALPHL